MTYVLVPECVGYTVEINDANGNRSIALLPPAGVPSTWVPVGSSPPLQDPQPLRFRILRVGNNLTSTVTYEIFSTGGFLQERIALITVVGTNPRTITIEPGRSNPTVSVVIIPETPQFAEGYIVTVNFDKPPINTNLRYDIGDTYTFGLDIVCPTSGLGVRVSLKRGPGVEVDTGVFIGGGGNFPGAGGGFADPDLPILPTLQPITDYVRIPIIDIQGQTTVDGQFLSDFKFIIQDEYKYDDACNIINNCNCNECVLFYEQIYKLKTTTFYQNNIPLETVVKGKGKTLREKLVNYYNKHKAEIGPSFQDFYERFIRYAMLKYILARLLYGDFNLNYLYRNFNKQFFKDLAKSRFCGFIEFFENPANNIIGYQRFFLSSTQC